MGAQELALLGHRRAVLGLRDRAEGGVAAEVRAGGHGGSIPVGERPAFPAVFPGGSDVVPGVRDGVSATIAA